MTKNKYTESVPTAAVAHAIQIGKVFTLFRNYKGNPNHHLLNKFSHEQINLGYRMYTYYLKDKEIQRIAKEGVK